jgi:hypothetical protein
VAIICNLDLIYLIYLHIHHSILSTHLIGSSRYAISPSCCRCGTSHSFRSLPASRFPPAHPQLSAPHKLESAPGQVFSSPLSQLPQFAVPRFYRWSFERVRVAETRGLETVTRQPTIALSPRPARSNTSSLPPKQRAFPADNTQPHENRRIPFRHQPSLLRNSCRVTTVSASLVFARDALVVKKQPCSTPTSFFRKQGLWPESGLVPTWSASCQKLTSYSRIFRTQ